MTMLPPTPALLVSPRPARFFRPKRLPCDPSSCDLMEWLQTDCPHDLLPKILAFAGPQMVSKLSQTNRFWNALVSQEQTWRTLSEELYKVCFQLSSFSRPTIISLIFIHNF
jgi:hypothetical protein